MTTNDTPSLWNRYRSVPIFYRIMVSLVLGAIVGLVAGPSATVLKPLGDILVRLLQMIVVPIVVLTLIMGMRRINPSNLGRVGAQTVGMYILTTAIAIIFGLAVANVVDPGVGVTIPRGAEAIQKTSPSMLQTFLNIFPTNPISSMADGNVLQVIFFSIVFGIGLAIVREETEEGSVVHQGATTLFRMIEAAANVMFKIVWGIMEYAVVGVFALMAWAFGSTGPALIFSFGKLILALGIAIVLHITLTYLLGIVVLAEGNPRSTSSGGRRTPWRRRSPSAQAVAPSRSRCPTRRRTTASRRACSASPSPSAPR